MKFDILGVIGFAITTIFAWFNTMEAIRGIEMGGKILGIVGGIVLMIVSIKHKTMQIHNEKATRTLNEMKQHQQEALKEIKKTIKENI